MRRHANLFLIIVMAVCAGCVSEKNEKATQSSNNGNAVPLLNDDRPTIAFVTNQIASFWNIAEVGCNDAAKDFDVEVDVRFPNEATATKQKQIVEDLMSSGIDALAISPIDADNQKEMVNKWAAQVPLLTHDSDAPQYRSLDVYRHGQLPRWTAGRQVN